MVKQCFHPRYLSSLNPSPKSPLKTKDDQGIDGVVLVWWGSEDRLHLSPTNCLPLLGAIGETLILLRMTYEHMGIMLPRAWVEDKTDAKNVKNGMKGFPDPLGRCLLTSRRRRNYNCDRPQVFPMVQLPKLNSVSVSVW